MEDEVSGRQTQRRHCRTQDELRVEDAFWRSLKEIARDRDTKLYDLVAVIDSKRRHSNLSSAIRLFALDHYRRQAVPLQGISGRCWPAPHG
jgi:predicted DNA-binding ribbon-helix-helix protein